MPKRQLLYEIKYSYNLLMKLEENQHVYIYAMSRGLQLLKQNPTVWCGYVGPNVTCNNKGHKQYNIPNNSQGNGQNSIDDLPNRPLGIFGAK